MQTGYRLDQAAETKALKAALWIRKLDNLSYGSDIKLATPVAPTVATIGVPTPAAQNVATATATPTAQVVATTTATPAPAPATTRKTTITPSSPLHEQIMKSITPGVSPSKIKHATQTTTVVTQPAPPPTIITTGVRDQRSPAPMEPAKPLQESPISSVGSLSPTATESTIATVSLPIARSRGKASISEIPTSIKAIQEDTTRNSENNDLQNLARAFLSALKKGQQTITLYEIDGSRADDKLVIQQKPSDKIHFFARGAGTGGRVIDDQRFYNVQGSIEQAATRLNMGDYYKGADEKVYGLGLSELSPNMHWAQRLDKTDRNFVMYPTWVRGNIRLYTAGTRRAAVSHNEASKALLNMVADIVNRGTFEQSDYAALEPSETQAANMVIRVAKPLIPSGVRFSVGNVSDINALRKRYKTLVSELAAGNQGKMIRGEMIGILQSLQRLKAMPKSKVDDLISGLNDL